LCAKVGRNREGQPDVGFLLGATVVGFQGLGF
jgi:hypothetical protein